MYMVMGSDKPNSSACDLLALLLPAGTAAETQHAFTAKQLGESKEQLCFHDLFVCCSGL